MSIPLGSPPARLWDDECKCGFMGLLLGTLVSWHLTAGPPAGPSAPSFWASLVLPIPSLLRLCSRDGSISPLSFLPRTSVHRLLPAAAPGSGSPRPSPFPQKQASWKIILALGSPSLHRPQVDTCKRIDVHRGHFTEPQPNTVLKVG